MDYRSCMKLAKNSLIALALAMSCWKAAFSLPVASEDSAPPELPNVDGIKSTLTSPPIKEFRLGDLHVEFERSTLVDLTQRLGIGKIQHRGDAADSENWLCFMATSNGEDRRIWLLSGELGGEQHLVDSIIVTKSTKKAVRSDTCPQLPSRFRELSLDGASWVNARMESIEKSLGQPSLKQGDWLFYAYEGKAPGTDFDVSALLGLRVASGVVTTLFASKITTD